MNDLKLRKVQDRLEDAQKSLMDLQGSIDVERDPIRRDDMKQSMAFKQRKIAALEREQANLKDNFDGKVSNHIHALSVKHDGLVFKQAQLKIKKDQLLMQIRMMDQRADMLKIQSEAVEKEIASLRV